MDNDAFTRRDGAEDYRQRLRKEALSSTYVFAVAVCGMADLTGREALHGAMCEWIERDWRVDDKGQRVAAKLKLGMAPRGHLKSSCWTVADVLRRATADPNTRILITNEVVDNVAKWILTMQAIVMSSTYQWLFPECVPLLSATGKPTTRWNQTQLELRRTAMWPQPTIEGIGVGGASTSNHYNLVHNDDPVGKRARDQPSEMQRAIDHRKLCWSLLVDPAKDTIRDCGTRWSSQDYIDWVLRNVDGLDVFKTAVMRSDGSPLWPERFPPQVIEALKREQGLELFELQYMNDSLGEGAAEHDVSRLRSFRWASRPDAKGKHERWVVLERPVLEGGDRWVRLADMTVTQTFDPAVKPVSTADRSAHVVVGLAPPDGDKPFDIVVLAARAARTDPGKSMAQARDVYDEFDPMCCAVETVGAFEVFFYEMARRWPGMRLRRLKTDTKKSKEVRVREFYPFIEQQRVYVHRTEGYELVREIAAFPHGTTVDLYDALAYTPQVWVPPRQPLSPDDEWKQWQAEAREARLAAMEARGDGRDPITGY